MEKGHTALRELLVTSLMIIGLTAAVFIITEGQGPSAGFSQASAPQEVVPQAAGTAGDLFDQGMARADSRFYDTDPSGTYDIRTYKWALPSIASAPDAVPVRQNDLRVASVRFNDRYDDALRGFAYRTYQKANLTGPPLIIGTAVFIGSPNLVDGYRESGEAFDIRYDNHPERSQTLEDCSVIYYSAMATPSGTPVYIYDVVCRIAYGAHP